VIKTNNQDKDAAMSETITSYKGFGPDWKCRDYQFAVGQTYEHAGDVEACASGFHACEYPLDVLAYYPPVDSKYAVVEQSGTLARHGGYSKVASSRISIKAEISLPGLIAAAVEYITTRCEPADAAHADGKRKIASATGYSSASSATGGRSASSATGYSSASSATGYSSASSATGDRSASSATGYSSASSATGYSPASSATGDRSASSATGDSSASSATGDSSASSATGDSSASSATGYSSASSATGDRSASSATGYSSASSATGDRSASSATGGRSASSATGGRSASSATGDSSASSATGYRSASLTTGLYSSSEIKAADDGKALHAIAIAAGRESKARAPLGSAIVCVYRNDDGELLHIRAAKVGENGIKADTWYSLNEDGEFVEAA
jgi:hypothetical protein